MVRTTYHTCCSNTSTHQLFKHSNMTGSQPMTMAELSNEPLSQLLIYSSTPKHTNAYMHDMYEYILRTCMHVYMQDLNMNRWRPSNSPKLFVSIFCRFKCSDWTHLTCTCLISTTFLWVVQVHVYSIKDTKLMSILLLKPIIALSHFTITENCAYTCMYMHMSPFVDFQVIHREI